MSTDLSARIGERSSAYEDAIPESRLRAFASAVRGSEELSFPPTMLTAFRVGEFELLERFGIPLARVLHGEQEYEYESVDLARELAHGIRYETTLANYREKKGSKGSLHLFVFETPFLSKGGKTLATARTTMVVRGDLP